MPPAGIVEAVDVFEQGNLGLPPCLPSPPPNQLGLERFEEALDHGVIKAIMPAKPPTADIRGLPRSSYKVAMLDDASKLPDDPTELKTVAVQLATTGKSQALKIAKLKH